jgi:hypothetical protein
MSVLRQVTDIGARRISVGRFYLFRKSNVIEHLIELGLMAPSPHEQPALLSVRNVIGFAPLSNKSAVRLMKDKFVG